MLIGEKLGSGYPVNEDNVFYKKDIKEVIENGNLSDLIQPVTIDFKKIVAYDKVEESGVVMIEDEDGYIHLMTIVQIDRGPIDPLHLESLEHINFDVPITEEIGFFEVDKRCDRAKKAVKKLMEKYQGE